MCASKTTTIVFTLYVAAPSRCGRALRQWLDRDRHVKRIGMDQRAGVAHDRHMPFQKTRSPRRKARKRIDGFPNARFLHVGVARAVDAASVKRDLHET